MNLQFRFPSWRGTALACSALVVLVATACTTATPGPAADLSEELTGGSGPFIGSPTGSTPPDGYEVHEYVAAGTATSYALGDSALDDGRWAFEPSESAAYRTRILVRRPSSPEAMSGTVIVEWLNVSGGIDADAEYASLVEEIVRQGHTWVGVSAQIIGVEGGPVLVELGVGGGLAGKGLKGIDAARYGSLVHPGDGYAYDIFTQVARALRHGGEPLGGVRPRVLIAAGESQSAMALTTYYDGVQPIAHAFDGFFIHSRGGGALPLVGPGESADLTGVLFGTDRPIFRDDEPAPVVELQAESDVTGILNSYASRQADSDTFRLWEVAGTAHADLHLLGPAASLIDCGSPVNNGPMHLVAKAAFRALDVWVRTGDAPATAARLDIGTSTSSPVQARDVDGIALGGIRSPLVDVPVDVLSGGATPDGGIACLLFGSTLPLSDARIAELYASRAIYEQQYADSADATIAAGFVLADDRDALIGFSQPLRVAP